MGHLIDTIMPRYHEACAILGVDAEYESVVMTATTNMAAENLGIATRRPTQTIHSFLRLKVADDYATGRSRLLRNADWSPHTKVIIFVDEYSTINRELLDEIRAATIDCKIVYVGDHCQLAPVGEKVSPIESQGIPFYELTEPMRNNGQWALMALCNQLRETVKTGEFKPLPIVPGVIDLLDMETMPKMLEEVFVNTPNVNSRVLAYTNKRVIQYNDYIRQIQNLPKEFTVGEVLVNNTAFQLPRRMLSVEEQVTIMEQSKNTEVIDIDENAQLTVRRSTLMTKFGEEFKDIPVPVDYDHYAKLLSYYKSQKKWITYYKLKNKFPDLRTRAAATVYKAQGSTHDSVFIDLDDIGTSNAPNQVARMLYVAGSRPRHRVFLFGTLPDKYGGPPQYI